MAIVTNTFRAANATTNRESLADVISMITPDDTPIYSMIGKGKATAIKPEWSVDDLAVPGRNIREEGDDYTFGAVVAPTRLANFTQIFRKDWIISNTQETTAEAGNATKRKRTKLKRGVELRKDVEFSIIDALPSLGGSIRQSGSLSSWLVTNTSRGGGGGANGGYNTGTGLTVAPTNGTQRAFSKVLTDTVMQSVYNNGGTPKNLVVSPYVKSVFVTFMSDTNVANFRYDVNKYEGTRTIVGNADYYEGPFGRVKVIPNRVMATSAAVARNAFFVDPDFMDWLWLRPIKEDMDVAKTGDAERGVLIGEGTLAVKNEKGLGVVADVFGLTASS